MKTFCLFLPILLSLVFPSCKKTIDVSVDLTQNNSKNGELIKYIIRKGQHYADQNGLQAVQYDELKFTVTFDSTSIYQASDSPNQEDINKLYGFSDNDAAHQQFSARLGWNWARSALRLYAYVYNNGERISQELCSIQIGTQYNCSIKVQNASYIFSVNNTSVAISRSSTTPKGSGYRLYPYFGGDETAPHDINIWIKEL
jgi:hypothetical protein